MAVAAAVIAALTAAAKGLASGAKSASKTPGGSAGSYQIAKEGSSVTPIETHSTPTPTPATEEKNENSIIDMVGNLIKNKIGEESSDERLKRIFNREDDALKCFAKIDAIMFEYNNKAKEIHPDGENHVDDDTHYGVKAQDLAKNPYTQSVVSEDKDGFLQVDPAELSTANTAVIGEICRRLLTIEKVLGLEVK